MSLVKLATCTMCAVFLSFAAPLAAQIIIQGPPPIPSPGAPPRVRPSQGRPQVTRPPTQVLVPEENRAVPNDWPQTRRATAQRYGGRQAIGRGAREYVRVRPGDGPSAIWTAGVTLQRAPKGLRIAALAPGGAAQRHGLEVGDYLLDASGYIIGDYQGIYYPFAQAIDYAADRSGWVEFLVWNKRTQAEETLWVRLDRRR